MKTYKLTSVNAEQTREMGEQIAVFAKPNDVFILKGDLGAGKTQFSKGFALGLGITDDVTSPTFNLVLVYEEAWIPLNHFDLYRLEHDSELEDIDFFGLIESGAVSLIEWGDRFPIVRDLSDLEITLESISENKRSIELVALSERGEEMLTELVKSLGDA